MSALTHIKPSWPAPDNVTAFTTTRIGGFSTGAYSSLNLGQHVGDDKQIVRDNRELLANKFDLPSEPRWLEQVHGIDVHRIAEKGAWEDSPPQADAAITKVPEVVCCVMTADCLPVFFCDRQGTEVAVAHAGWRGLAAGVLEATIAAFQAEPKDIIAWAAPAISQRHFEVGAEVKQQLGGSEKAWREGHNKGKHYADLYTLAEERLLALGIGWFDYEQRCTYSESNLFFSHRRDGPCGRQVSMIYLKNE